MKIMRNAHRSTLLPADVKFAMASLGLGVCAEV